MDWLTDSKIPVGRTAKQAFDWLQTNGGVSGTEMLRTFNCGVGMVLCVAPQDAQRVCDLLAEGGEQAWIIGRIAATEGAPTVAFTAGGAV